MKDENSVQTLARLSWDAFVISNTVAAITMKEPKARVPDVDELIGHNHCTLDELRENLKALAEFDESKGDSWELGNLIKAVEADCSNFQYPDRAIQSLLVDVEELIEDFREKAVALEDAENQEDADCEEEYERKFKAYRKANNLPNPRELEGGFGLLFGILWLVMVVLLWKEALNDPSAPTGVYGILFASTAGLLWYVGVKLTVFIRSFTL